ncbi:hypothetical protein C1645_842006 [Glomus cerebriforme]|uniref:Uncharacterized protein n=1 Tax=Glomus cerebriforme TaxID=658196 RepID=A0A397S2H7_9GLOM|nr:hypothetical protein C1645_842006 [Glomus cerebriforme]
MSKSNFKSLLYQVFFQLSIIFTICKEEHYQLSNGYNGLQFFYYIFKNNQYKIQEDKTQIILIFADDNRSYLNIQLYLSKCSNSANENFYLYPKTFWLKSNNWYKLIYVGKIN